MFMWTFLKGNPIATKNFKTDLNLFFYIYNKAYYDYYIPRKQSLGVYKKHLVRPSVCAIVPGPYLFMENSGCSYFT